MAASMKITGGVQLARNLDELSKRLSRQIQRQALVEAGDPIRLAMAQLAPREPGAPDLADNMIISTVRPKGWGNAVVIAIGAAKEFFYARFQEFGTAQHRSQQFARPSYDRHVGGGSTLKIITSALSRVLIQRGFGSTRSSGGGTGL